jgi:hypothetical protein
MYAQSNVKIGTDDLDLDNFGDTPEVLEGETVNNKMSTNAIESIEHVNTTPQNMLGIYNENVNNSEMTSSTHNDSFTITDLQDSQDEMQEEIDIASDDISTHSAQDEDTQRKIEDHRIMQSNMDRNRLFEEEQQRQKKCIEEEEKKSEERLVFTEKVRIQESNENTEVKTTPDCPLSDDHTKQRDPPKLIQVELDPGSVSLMDVLNKCLAPFHKTMADSLLTMEKSISSAAAIASSVRTDFDAFKLDIYDQQSA